MNDAKELRNILSSPIDICHRLGLLGDHIRTGSGVLVRCPVHTDKTPSCSVQVGKDRTIYWKCHSCDASGDVLSLIAAVNGLDHRHQFRDVLRVATELAGTVLLTAAPAPTSTRPHTTEYPPQSEIASLWGMCVPLAGGQPSVESLRQRAINPWIVRRYDLARHLTRRPESLPGIARTAHSDWLQLGYTLIIPVYDWTLQMRSLRAWRCSDNRRMAKRLPPAGYSSQRLIMANRAALELLSSDQGENPYEDLIIVEGEPDYLTRATVDFDRPVIGVFSGSWSNDFAKRVPDNTSVYIRTHCDKAGDKYAGQICDTLEWRCVCYRRTDRERPDENECLMAGTLGAYDENVEFMRR